MKIHAYFAGLAALACAPAALAQDEATPAATPAAVDAGVRLPAGLLVDLEIVEQIGSATNSVGDEFSIKTEATDTLEMEVEAGETYFVETSAAMGVLVYRLNLSPSDMGAFEAAYPKMKPAKPLTAK